jgi:hypothetical protein
MQTTEETFGDGALLTREAMTRPRGSSQKVKLARLAVASLRFNDRSLLRENLRSSMGCKRKAGIESPGEQCSAESQTDQFRGSQPFS